MQVDSLRRDLPPDLPPDYLVIPDRLNITDRCVDQHVRDGFGDRIAIRNGDQNVTFAELARLVNRCGNALRSLGVGRGDHVFLRLGMTLECMVAMFGAMKIGAIPVPTSILLGESEIAYILDHSDSVAAITSADLAGPLREAAPSSAKLRHIIVHGEPGPGEHSWDGLLSAASDELEAVDTAAEDQAYMIYTSGSTGKPKGIERAHRVLIGGGDPIAKYYGRLTRDDVVFQPHQDLSFSFPLGQGFMFPLYAGASLVLAPVRSGGRFDPEAILRAIERHRVTILSAVTTLYRRLLAIPDAEHRFDVSSLRCCWAAAEPLPPETLAEWRSRFGVDILETFGQSEIPSFIGNAYDEPIKPGSLGKVFPGIRVAVVDDEGHPVPPNTQGHLVVDAAHPGLCSGYRNMPERWAEVCRNGWYYTMDYVTYDEDGYFWYISRSDDLIKTRGYSVSPREVELALMSHPAVQEAGVIGAPDGAGGTCILGYVTLRPGFSPSPGLADDIRQFVRGSIAPYKTPREVIFVPELPKTTSGKLMRRRLTELLPNEPTAS